MKNRGSMVILVIGVPLFLVCAMWKGHVVRFHSTVYSVVLLGDVLCLGCLGGQVCMMLTICVWCARVGVL